MRLILLISLPVLISCFAASSAGIDDNALEMPPESEALKIPGLASLELILKAIETYTGYSITGVLAQFQTTIAGIIEALTLTAVEIFMLLSENLLLDFIGANTLEIINRAILYAQTSVEQAVDLLGWMMSVADVMEELQPILAGITVGTYLLPTFLEGLAIALVDVLAVEEPEVSEQIQEVFGRLEANVTEDINALLSAMLPSRQDMLIVKEQDL